MVQTNTRITLLALSVFAATQANAALYNVVEVDPTWIADSYRSSFGVAIQPSSVDGSAATNFNSCFLADSIGGTTCFDDNGDSNVDDFVLAGETRYQKTMGGQAVDGLSYREEAPFGMDNAFSFAQSQSDFENYCSTQLLYATCSSWAEPFWAEWSKELNNNSTPNSIAFIEGDSSYYDNSVNRVINSLTSTPAPIGIQSSLGNDRASVDAIDAVATPLQETLGTFDKSRAWKTDGTYTVGSVSSDYTNSEGDYYSSKAAIWGSDGDVVQIDWPSGKEEEDERLAQGSMRDFTVDSGVIYGVGYNTYDSDNNYMNATIFKVNEGSYKTSGSWSSTDIDNAQVEIGGDYTYSNTVLTAVNDNLIAIGEAKRAGSRPSGGAAANRIFVVPDVSAASPTATFISDGISFSGAGGHANAINNYNEIVGQIDTESSRESGGKPRRKRAFIYPYNGTGSNATRMGIFANKAWLLDDLTNGSNANTDNNEFRILTASDINDAGVIAATAIKCSGGYDSTAHNATCGGGDQIETTVAVKLIPIENATSSDISARGYESNNIERSGGALGGAGLALLSLLWFRRRR